MFYHTASKQLKIFFNTACQILSAHKNGHRIQQIWIPLHYSLYSVRDILQELVYEGRRKPFFKHQRSSETNGMTSTSDSQNQKSNIAAEKAYSSSGKGEWRTYSAHSLLIIWLVIRPTVTFWHSLRTSGNANDEPLAKIAVWHLSLIHIWRCRRIERCRSRWSPYH